MIKTLIDDAGCTVIVVGYTANVGDCAAGVVDFNQQTESYVYIYDNKSYLDTVSLSSTILFQQHLFFSSHPF